MRQFFREILELDDKFMASPVLDPKHSSKVDRPIIPYEGRKTMHYFYKTNKTLPYMPPKKKVKQPTKANNIYENFKIQAVVLSLEEVKLLVDVLLTHKEEFEGMGFRDVVKFAQSVRNADQKGRFVNECVLTDMSRPEGVIPYMLFINEQLPSEMEGSYTARLHRSTTTVMPKNEGMTQVKLVSKLKEATRSLLFSLDSFSMFFDLHMECSLLQIADFVIQFSYLFESKKASMQEKIPVKLLAQFIITYLNNIPEEYKKENFYRFYLDIISDCEKRFEDKRKVANQNKQILLMGINTMEKHVNDVTQEEKIQRSLQTTRTFFQFIKDAEIIVCIYVHGENQTNGIVSVARISDCPHTKLDYVGAFVMGNIRPPSAAHRASGHVSRLSTRHSMIKQPSGHVSTIEEFAKEFVKLSQVQRSTESEKDDLGVGAAFFQYLEIVYEVAKVHPLFEKKSDKEIEETIEEIEKYIMRSMFKDIFPPWASDEDERLFQKTIELEWLRPEHLDILPSNRNEDMWEFAIQSLRETDESMSPIEKLHCLIECVTILVNVLDLCSSGDSGVGSDDTLPIIIFVVIKAQPRRLYSNLNYITKFRHQKKMLAQEGFCFQQIQIAAHFVEEANAGKFNISPEEYARNVAESKKKLKK